MSDRDRLISRIVDREDSLEDWVHMDQLSVSDERLYDSLIDAMRDEATLRTAVSSVIAVADSVELAPFEPGFFERRPWLAQWSGWLAAALIALAFLFVERSEDRKPGDVPTANARQPESNGTGRTSIDEPVSARLAGHKVLRQLPDVMVETRPIPNSKDFEVIYYRRTLERAVVSGAVAHVRDDGGRSVPTPVDLTNYQGSRTDY